MITFLDNMTLKENEKDSMDYEIILESIQTFGINQYGLIKSYQKENNCSFQDALLNVWIRNRCSKIMYNFDIVKF